MPRVCTRKWTTDGLPGCVLRRKTKTGLTVAIYHAGQAGYNGHGPWLLACEDHGVAVSRKGQRICRDTLSKPESWCPVCDSENANGVPFGKEESKVSAIVPVTPPVRHQGQSPVSVSVEPPEPPSPPIRPPKKSSGAGVELLDCGHWSFWEEKGVCTGCAKRVPKVQLREKAPPSDPRCPWAFRIIE